MSRLGEFANIYELLDESDSSGVETGKKAKEAVDAKKAAAAAALAPPTANKPVNTQGQNERRSPSTRGPRGPRQEGDRPQGERRPRQEGDRPQGERRPRQEGDRPQGERRPRQEGDRPRQEGDRPRRPRPTSDSPREGGENSFAESGQAAAGGEPRARLPRDQARGPRPDRGYERRNPGDQDTRPGKREFDRRSGTGRGKETSKGGAGRGNWGSVEEATALEGNTADAAAAAAEGAAEKEGETAAVEAVATPAAETTEAAPADDEPPVRTLATYLSERKSTAAAQPARKAGDGETNSYAGFQPFKREEESLFAVEKSAKTKSGKGESKDAKEKRVAADQVLRFQQERREGSQERGNNRGGRGGRGGNQGGQRRGGNAGSNAPNFGDASAFPGLSTKA